LFFTWSSCKGEEQPLSTVAVLTRFGYVLSGPLQVPSCNTCSSNIAVSHVLKTDAIIFQRDEEVNKGLKEYLNCENLETKMIMCPSKTKIL